MNKKIDKILVSGILAGLLGNILIFNTLFVNKLSGYYLGNNFDSNLIGWILEWGYHALRTYPEMFWNANQFYPHNNSLAYSDSMLAVQLFYSPLRILGLDSIAAMFASLICISTMASILLADALGQLKLFNWKEIFIIVFLSNYSLSSTTFLVDHYQLFGILFAPAILTYIYLAFKTGGSKAVMAASGIFVFSACVATYIAPMMLALYVLISLYYITSYRATGLISFINLLRSLKLYIWIYLIVIFFALYFFQIKQYLNLFGGMSAQNLLETHIYSARINSILSHVSAYSHVYKQNDFSSGVWERSYFPGIFVLSVVVIGFFTKLKKHILNEKFYEIEDFYLYSIVVFVAAFALSLGPYIYSGKSVKIYSIFSLLAGVLPGVENIRAPGRYGMFFGVFYGVSAVVVYRYLVKFIPARAGIIFAVLMALIFIDSRLSLQKFDSKIENENLYQRLSDHVSDRESLLILPVKKNGHYETIKNMMDQLNGSRYHWGWNIVGYGSRDTPELNQIIDLDSKLQTLDGNESLSEIFKYSCELKVSKIVLFKKYYSGRQEYNKITGCYSEIYDDKEMLIYKLTKGL